MPGKATIIEVNGDRAVILTEHCEYKEITVPGTVQAGEEINYLPVDLSVPGYRHPARRALAAVATFMVFLLITFTIYQQVTLNTVYAYVTLDINPSLEIGISKHHRVVSTDAYNDEGRRLLDQLDLKGKDVEFVLAEIVKLCGDSQYLNQQSVGQIVTTLSFQGQPDDGELLETIDARLDQELRKNDIEAEVYYINISKKNREQALNKGASPLLYFLWQETEGKITISPGQEISIENPDIKSIAKGLAVKTKTVKKDKRTETSDRKENGTDVEAGQSANSENNRGSNIKTEKDGDKNSGQKNHTDSGEPGVNSSGDRDKANGVKGDEVHGEKAKSGEDQEIDNENSEYDSSQDGKDKEKHDNGNSKEKSSKDKKKD